MPHSLTVLTRFSIVFLLSTVLLSGCGFLQTDEDDTRDWSANKFYGKAKGSLKDGDYEEAIRLYEMLESRYPFGAYAQQAQLEIAYAYYKYEEPDSAIAATERFIKMYPRHPSVDYAYYLKGLSNFTRNLGFMERYIPTDATQRDQSAALTSFDDFSELVRRFPDSKYAEDSRKRMVFLRNSVAAYEVHAARWYLRRGAFIAAANRGREVVEKYQRTPAMEDALAIMYFAYDELDMNALKADVKRVIETNYPQHPVLYDKATIRDYTGEKAAWWKFWDQ
ncbi:MAG: outer membrane protein assembly factor BamD [Gammaproteobacteria bacterium]|nr:MAG: outer membrane protein assembly factor BamD [Gammaproteobacteria bacterium]